MPDNFISLAVRGNTEIAARLKNLPPAAIAAGTDSAVQLIALRFNRYAQAAAYNYVPYSAVGGFFSKSQQGLVMARIRQGSITIPYARTRADHFSVQGRGKDAKVVSNRVSMMYSMGDLEQARLQKLRGWGTVSELLNANNADILKAFELGVQDAITNMDRQFSEQMANTAP